MGKNFLSLLLFIALCAVILGLTVRGLPGNPSIEVLNRPEWKDDGPLELSPERGRFGILYSIIEDRSLEFSLPVARFTTPDVAYQDGRYVSLFAPGVSFLLIPGYLVGKYFGAAQVGTYAVIGLFALLNIILLRAIGVRIGVNPWAASIAAVVFVFATPAFAYAVSLYQHHISTFLILLAIYALLRMDNFWGLSLIWFLAAVSVVIDYPNLFLMLPIALAAFLKILFFTQDAQGVHVHLKPLRILTFLAAILPLVLFFGYNKLAYGNPLQLSGTLKSVEEIDERGLPTESLITKTLKLENKRDPNVKKTVLGFFHTRNLLRGFYTHFFSPDRGIIRYAPIVLFGVPGLFYLYRRNQKFAKLLLAIIGINILLYSMWGDPYGGWAFGSRYLIPTYALSALGLAMLLSKWRHNYLLLAIFALIFGYSTWVNTLGAITSSRNPPRLEVLALEAISGREEKYTYERNLQYLTGSGSKSFVFQSFASQYVTAQTYQQLLTGLILVGVLALGAGLVARGKEENML